MSDPSLGAALRGAVDLSSLRNRPAAAQQPAAGGDAPAGAPDLVTTVSDATFPQIMQLSQQIPVVMDLWSPRSGVAAELSPLIEKVVRSYEGRIVLARVDVDENPQIAQAFQLQSIPMIVALIGGRPVPMFNEVVPEEQIREVFDQLLQIAQQQGITGSVTPPSGSAQEEPAEPPLPPLHQEAYDAIQRGDYAAAVAAYEKALKENPRDADAEAGLGQVRLLQRTAGADLQQARRAAAEAPQGVAEQLAVADLDVVGGHVDDAFSRLLDLFAALPSDERGPVRDRLVELFGVVGAGDARVIAARGRLTSLLF
ncbi:tetratricopeptide repeat protein [Microbacterium indicum]|uniref:tetratricopeptide repeat protein n=1 Tax=Microbacterium indicum TaxID=358100 RepID=UPI00041C2715|nr:tetratricopeptide repeat protein [Microbacterium indicum]